MAANIQRYEWPSTKDCLPAAAAVAISALIGPDVLTPAQIVQKYEETIHGPIPSIGADMDILRPMIQSAYNIKVVQPDKQYDWDIARAKRIIDAGIPLMTTYAVFWDDHWKPTLFHGATIWNIADGQIFLWDQDRRRDIVWTYEEFHWQRTWDANRKWFRSLDHWDGWLFAFIGLNDTLPL